MKKVIMFALLIWGIGLKAQDLDVFQADLLWNYQGSDYQPNRLGNGWQIQPEIRYYFLEAHGSGLIPYYQNTLTYEKNFLVGIYFCAAWQEEWKRASVTEYPKIIEGISKNAGIQKFDFGLSLQYIPDPTVFLTLEAGMSIKSLYIKNGVHDSVPEYPYYQGVPIKFGIRYLDDSFDFFNKINLLLETNNSFHEYQSIQSGEKFFIDTAAMADEHFFAVNLECNILSPWFNRNALLDVSLINQYQWYQGKDYFGLMMDTGKNEDYKVGIGLAIREFQKLDEAIKISALFGQSGFSLGLTIKLGPLYDLSPNH
ncbi:TPA: hypothetical protein DCZ15_00865 [Candidatus Falkowbacteria bacterium]|nr:MAG: hypothetical protein UV95_C0003G0034 [Candidatus Falkowbacteria bacterium GW2011_GWF2_43_32]HBA36406.1 hypothetical protein [Candidatus Falkowbacteria bacterium]